MFNTIDARFCLICVLPARSVYNSSQIEPYTGRLDINDYLKDLQLPHMIDLVEKYDAELMVRRQSICSQAINSGTFSGAILGAQI